MSIDDAVERLTDTKDDINKWVGVYIGLLAVVLAICNVGGANAAKDAGRANLDAANTWAFFQAKNIRRTAITMAADELELQLAAQPSMPPAARQAFEAKIKDYRATAQKLTTDPERRKASTSCSPRANRSRPSATWRCARTPISTGARRSCRSRSCWLPSISSSAICRCSA